MTGPGLLKVLIIASVLFFLGTDATGQTIEKRRRRPNAGRPGGYIGNILEFFGSLFTSGTTTMSPVNLLANECKDNNNCCDFSMGSYNYIKCSKKNGCAPSCNGVVPSIFILSEKCTQAAECCAYRKFSSDHTNCCREFGCCTNCCSDTGNCRSRPYCKRKGGVCRNTECLSGETAMKSKKACKGSKCTCCVPNVATVDICTDNQAAQEECCGLDPTSDEFLECAKSHSCIPICDSYGCEFDGELYEVDTVVKSDPDKCFELKCESVQITEPPYFIQSIIQYDYSEGCGCCVLDGKMYENGHVLTDDGYCWAIGCVDGEWVNLGYLNSECRVCTVHEISPLVTTFDNAFYTPTVTSDCQYSLTQQGSSTSPDYYFYATFTENDVNYPFVYTGIEFQDTGSTPYTCPPNHIEDCSFGPTPLTPTLLDGKTFVFQIEFSFSNRTMIVGVNGITAMYQEHSLYLFAHNSLQEELGGLCGQYNGDMSDDLTTRDGQVTTDVDEFTDSWQVGCPARKDTESLAQLRNEMEDCNHCNTTSCGRSTFQARQLSTCDAVMSSMIQSLNNLDIPESIESVLRAQCMGMACTCIQKSSETECQTIIQDLITERFEIIARSKSPWEINDLANHLN